MKTVTIYTDGACSGNPGPGGWCAILQYGANEKQLSGGEANTTNNRMELTAVIEALRALKAPCRVELWSDSKYVIDALEKGISRAGAVTPMLEAGMTPEDILGQVCGSLGVAFLETTEVTYKCYCTRERVERALISLGRKELEEIRQEGKTFPVECQFCDAVYSFTPEDIGKLLEKI